MYDPSTSGHIMNIAFSFLFATMVIRRAYILFEKFMTLSQCTVPCGRTASTTS